MRARFLTTLLTPTLLLGLALLATPVAYAQGTPDDETPANEGVCDELRGATPGLYGLCVGFCEAQDCEATLDEATGEVTFGDNCKKRSPRTLEVYNKLALPGDPAMPCVVVENSCPCEGLVTVDGVAWDSTFQATRNTCRIGNDFALSVTEVDLGAFPPLRVGDLAVYPGNPPHLCQIVPSNPSNTIAVVLSTQAEVEACIASLVAIAAEDGVICPDF